MSKNGACKIKYCKKGGGNKCVWMKCVDATTRQSYATADRFFLWDDAYGCVWMKRVDATTKLDYATADSFLSGMICVDAYG